MSIPVVGGSNEILVLNVDEVLSCTNGLYICGVYAHVDEHVLTAHQILPKQKLLYPSISQGHNDSRIFFFSLFVFQLTLLVAYFGSFGKPLTEFESMERKI